MPTPKNRYELPLLLEVIPAHKLTMLRSLCLKSGVQLRCRDFDFTVATCINLDDVLDLFPIIKYARHTHKTLLTPQAYLPQLISPPV
jgi:hypothetical protein